MVPVALQQGEGEEIGKITFVDCEHSKPAVHLVCNLITAILNLVPMQIYICWILYVDDVYTKYDK